MIEDLRKGPFGELREMGKEMVVQNTGTIYRSRTLVRMFMGGGGR